MARIVRSRSDAQTWTFFENAWHADHVGIMGPRTHGAWLGSTVFDGARSFEGVAPDLDLHMERVNQSAHAFRLKPLVSTARWIELAHEGMAHFDPELALYIRPMYWAERGAAGSGVRFDPESTRWCMCVYQSPMPSLIGQSVTLSPFRKPTAETAPLDAKAGCLYPNNARALMEANDRGYDNCLMLDALGHVAELANANVMLAKDGVVFTPAPNGTFLNGVTRRRLIGLFRQAGVSVVETSLSYSQFLGADEIFAVGNFAKVLPVTRIEERTMPAGPLFAQARALYWDFAHGR